MVFNYQLCMSRFLYFQDQTTNACAFLLINRSLNEDKEPNLTTNHRSPRAKRFANYALKTGMEGVPICLSTQDFLLEKVATTHLY
jgi:hypothetical protein